MITYTMLLKEEQYVFTKIVYKITVPKLLDGEVNSPSDVCHLIVVF